MRSNAVAIGIIWMIDLLRSERPLSLIRDGPLRTFAVTVHNPSTVTQRDGDLEADMTDSSINSPGHCGLHCAHSRHQTQTANLFLP
ncbi:uncharacterized [Tachysurus ichikawai]